MKHEVIIPYEESRNYVQEADVLLFRAHGLVGKGITLYTGGHHSHVGLAHWDSGGLYCVEQREFKGGRSVRLSSQISDYTIDVYRSQPYIYTPKVERNGKFDIFWKIKHLSENTKKDIANTALELTGQPYGWGNIWEFCKCYLPLIHLLQLVKKKKVEDNVVPKNFVCSTVVTYAYRKHYKDPCPNLSDVKTSPADLAQSSLFNYMFTIGG